MKRDKYIAKTFEGLEPILEAELKEMGIEDTQTLNRSVAFQATFEEMMKANMTSRTALRIYKPLFEFEVKNEGHLYKQLLSFPWDNFIKVDDTFAIESIVLSKEFRNSHFVSLKSKDAIADYFMNKHKRRPDVDVRRADWRIQVYISNGHRCVISVDTSGQQLYKRGYKNRQTEASINECLAAGLMMMTGWKGEMDLYDPMCGSATFSAEALMIAKNYPPNLKREKWAFQKFPGYQKRDYIKLKKELESGISDCDMHIFTSDSSVEVMDIAKMNLFDIGFKYSRLIFSKSDFFYSKPETDNGIMVLNPPYNERLEIEEDREWYKRMGDTLKQQYQGFDVWVISSNKKAMKQIGLKPSVTHRVVNGKLPCEWCKYEIY